MKFRSDINAMTALVYGGAAFLLVIVGFRSILATLGDHVGVMTYLSIAALGLEFVLLILYAKAIYNLGPETSEGHPPAATASVADMSGKEISELTKAVIKVAEMGEGLANLSNGKVRDEVKKEVNDILSKAIKK